MMDLVIRGGIAVTAGGRTDGAIGIKDGKIVQIGGDMTGEKEIDAGGRFITPGGVDAHVHLTPPTRLSDDFRWSDDFESGTRAAIKGGITTVGNMSFAEFNQTMAEGIAVDEAEANRLAVADFFMHPVLMSPTEANLDCIKPLHDEGYTSIKFFLSWENFDKNVPHFLEAMLRTKKEGGIALIHCEDSAIMECCCNLLRESGKLGSEYYPDARPTHAEAVASHRAVGFAETTGCPIYVVHLASARALAACHEGRMRGVPVYVETRPIYLHLTRERFEEEDGAKYAGAPPLREKTDVDTLWAGLQFGSVDTIATDHAPWSLEDKLDPAFDATNLRQGVSDLETCLPMLYSAGVLTGRLSLEQFVAVTSTNPAKLFGMYPQKGAIDVGSDADLVIWDDNDTRVIDGATMESRCDYSPYDGMTVTGWPRWTISRGDIVVDGKDIVAEAGRGELVRRGPHRQI